MNILNVGQNYRVKGGSDNYMLSLGELLSSQEHRVVPFSAQHPDNLQTPFAEFFPEDVDFEKPRVSDILRFLYNKDAAVKLGKLLSKQSIDIAHLHIFYGKLTASIVSQLHKRKIPIVQTLHEYRLICPVSNLYRDDEICEECEGHKFYRAIRHRCNRGSFSRSLLSTLEVYTSRFLGYPSYVDHFITVSDFMREKLAEYGVPAEKMTTVHNFIDCRKFIPKYNHGDYLLYFGRLDKSKGLQTLLEAMRMLPDCQLVVAGNGPSQDIIQDYIDRYRMRNVTLIGFCQDEQLAELIRGSFATILPSEWYEGFPMAILESFAYGKPVVGSDIGGIFEAINDGKDGLLFPVGHVDKLKMSIEWLASSPGESVAMGKSGRAKVEEYFNQDEHYQKIMAVYERIVATRN